jgi:hypothetical protein
MIITQEFLIAMSACPEGMDAVNQLNIIGQDDKVFAQSLVKSGYTEYAVWIRQVMKSYEGIKFSGDYKVNRYMVFNPLTGQYEYANTKEEVLVLKAKIIDTYMASQVIPLIDIQEEIIATDGTAVSSKIDL